MDGIKSGFAYIIGKDVGVSVHKKTGLECKYFCLENLYPASDNMNVLFVSHRIISIIFPLNTRGNIVISIENWIKKFGFKTKFPTDSWEWAENPKYMSE